MHILFNEWKLFQIPPLSLFCFQLETKLHQMYIFPNAYFKEHEMQKTRIFWTHNKKQKPRFIQGKINGGKHRKGKKVIG